jgi:hypothetical protein
MGLVQVPLKRKRCLVLFLHQGLIATHGRDQRENADTAAGPDSKSRADNGNGEGVHGNKIVNGLMD